MTKTFSQGVKSSDTAYHYTLSTFDYSNSIPQDVGFKSVGEYYDEKFQEYLNENEIDSER